PCADTASRHLSIHRLLLRRTRLPPRAPLFPYTTLFRSEKAGQPLSSFNEMKADGSTDGGCWIYAGVYADGGNQARRRTPGSEQDEIAAEWGWAWPANRRMPDMRRSEDPQGGPRRGGQKVA